MAGDSFFAKPSSSKRKRPVTAAPTSSTASKGRPAAAPVKRSRGKRDEELSSDDGGEDVNVEDMDLTRDTRGGESDEEERDAERRETGGEKRLRIAREYLKGLEAEQQLGAFSLLSAPTALVRSGSASCALAAMDVSADHRHRQEAGALPGAAQRWSLLPLNLHADLLPSPLDRRWLV